VVGNRGRRRGTGGGQPPDDITTRQVHFYRWRTVRPEDAGKFNLQQAASLIGQLQFGTGDRYQEIERGHDFCVWLPPTSGHSLPLRMQLGVSRRSGLPMLEEAGNISPLSIFERQGLLEVSHVVFFAGNVVGIELNSYGPRITRLPRYFRTKFPNELPAIVFEVLLRADVQEQLMRLREINLINLRLNRSRVDLDQERDESMFGTFRALMDNLDAPVVQIMARSQPRSGRSLPERALDQVRGIARHPDVMSAADTFKIQGREEVGDAFEELDLLRNQLIASREVARVQGRHRAIDPDAMFLAIENAHGDMAEEIARATALGR